MSKELSVASLMLKRRWRGGEGGWRWRSWGQFSTTEARTKVQRHALMSYTAELSISLSAECFLPKWDLVATSTAKRGRYVKIRGRILRRLEVGPNSLFTLLKERNRSNLKVLRTDSCTRDVNVSMGQQRKKSSHIYLRPTEYRLNLTENCDMIAKIIKICSFSRFIIKKTRSLNTNSLSN